MAQKRNQAEHQPWENDEWPNDEDPATNRPVTDGKFQCTACKKPIATTMYNHKCFACNQLKKEKQAKTTDSKKCSMCERSCPQQYDTCFNCKYPNKCEDCGAKCGKAYTKCFICSTTKKPEPSF